MPLEFTSKFANLQEQDLGLFLFALCIDTEDLTKEKHYLVFRSDFGQSPDSE